MPQSRYVCVYLGGECVCVVFEATYMTHGLQNKPHPQVFNRLQRLQLCISYAALLKRLDEGAEGHDEKVTEWQDTLQKCAIYIQQNVSTSYRCSLTFDIVQVQHLVTQMIDEQEEICSLDIALEHFESSFTSMEIPHVYAQLHQLSHQLHLSDHIIHSQ